MFFSIKESHSSLAQSKAGQREEKEKMKKEMEDKQAQKDEAERLQREKEAQRAATQRAQIVTPGRRSVPATPVVPSGSEIDARRVISTRTFMPLRPPSGGLRTIVR